MAVYSNVVDRREVLEGVQVQGVHEEISYAIDVSAVTVIANLEDAKAWRITGGVHEEVTSTIFLGSGSAEGGVVRTPIVRSLTAGELYKVSILYSTEVLNNVYEVFLIILAQN